MPAMIPTTLLSIRPPWLDHPTMRWMLLGLGLAGCAVGPDFVRPPAPAQTRFTETQLPARTSNGATSQAFQPAHDIPGDWWTLFHSPPLTSLVRQALTENPDLVAAQATLRHFREIALAGEGALYPQVSGQLEYTREKLSSGGRRTPASLFNLATAQLNASLTLDVFGGTRRSTELLVAAADAERFQLEASYLSISTGVVLTAIQEASYRAQIAVTQDIIAILRQQLGVIRAQVNLGAASLSDVLTQQSTLSQAEATLPPLRRLLQQQRDQLAALTGRFPSDGVPSHFAFETLTLPRDLPVSLPSNLVAQRPDIQIAAEQLHQATAQIGVATANMLPQITLTGSIGSSALRAGDLFSPGTALWNIGAGLLQPMFQGGTLEHQRRAAIAAAQAAAAQYQAIVLNAFQAVADALQALQADAAALAAERDAAVSSRRGLDIARSQYRLGGLSFAAVLLAQRTYAQAQLSLAQATAAQYLDTVALLQALGGGWWNRTDAPAGPNPRHGPLTTILSRQGG